MELHVNEVSKTVEIWLSNPEKQDVSVRETLKPLCAGYNQKKYLVAVFESGTGDLCANTKDLLLNNRTL